MTSAEKMHLITELLGGQIIRDEYGDEIGVTPPVITPADARKLLDFVGANQDEIFRRMSDWDDVVEPQD